MSSAGASARLRTDVVILPTASWLTFWPLSFSPLDSTRDALASFADTQTNVLRAQHVLLPNAADL